MTSISFLTNTLTSFIVSENTLTSLTFDFWNSYEKLNNIKSQNTEWGFNGMFWSSLTILAIGSTLNYQRNITLWSLAKWVWENNKCLSSRRSNFRVPRMPNIPNLGATEVFTWLLTSGFARSSPSRFQNLLGRTSWPRHQKKKKKLINGSWCVATREQWITHSCRIT